MIAWLVLLGRSEASKNAEIMVLRHEMMVLRLGAGGDPAVIGPWIAETQAQKVAARAEIRSATGPTPDDQRRNSRDRDRAGRPRGAGGLLEGLEGRGRAINGEVVFLV